MSCRGLIGRLLGHNYQPRYTTSLPAIKRVNEIYDEEMLPKIIEASKSHTYHDDVCIRYGSVINRT